LPLKENTLFGEIDRVQVAIERLKTFEPEEGYEVGISGGKDSTAIDDLSIGKTRIPETKNCKGCGSEIPFTGNVSSYSITLYCPPCSLESTKQMRKEAFKRYTRKQRRREYTRKWRIEKALNPEPEKVNPYQFTTIFLGFKVKPKDFIEI